MATPAPTSCRCAGNGPGGLADQTDAQLLADARLPAESFAVFYRRHVDALIRFAASRGLSPDAAADVVSESFLAALGQRRRYRPEHDTARLWLLTIAARRIADLHRRRGAEIRRERRLRSEAIVLTQMDLESYAALLDREDERGLDALADLPALQQQILRSRVVEDRSYAEIAAALGLSEPATRQHVSRGLAALRKILGGHR